MAAAAAPRRVLIAGAGIAGPVVAYWLGRAGIRSTLIERAPDLRTSGQTLDINGVARQVVERMGLTSAIKAACTGEKGTLIVDENDRTRATLPVGFGPTNEYEIVRHLLSEVFYGASKDSTEYIFNDSITSIVETDSEAVVSFASGAPDRAFDAIVAADGIHSSTRSLVFDRDSSEVTYVPMGTHSAYFSVPSRPEEDGIWSKWCFLPGRRSIWLRPTGSSSEAPAMLANLLTRDAESQRRLKGYRHLSQVEQKALFEDFFANSGWKAERILAGLDAADDFYIQEIAQIKASQWSKGRVVLVGDAAYSPSPFSGMGTSCAITGAFILGNELAKRDQSVSQAFAAYERLVRPHVEKCQADAIGPSLANFLLPETSWGLTRLFAVLGTVSAVVNSPIKRLLALLGGEGQEDEKIVLPDYPHTR